MTKELGIIVGVEEKLPEVMLTREDLIPQELKGTGIRIDVIKAGDPRPFARLGARPYAAIPEYDCSWYEVMRSGVGLAHYQVTGGTLGDYNAAWGVGASNNHVLANQNKAKIGDPIHQPSPICAVTNRVVGTLAAFEPIKFVGEGSPCSVSQGWASFCNLFMQAAHRKTRFKAIKYLKPFAAETMNHVDLAFMRFTDGIQKDEHIERTDFDWQGSRPEATLLEILFKSGARTRYTEFPCMQKYMTVSVGYSLGKIGMYEDQDVGDNPGGILLNAGDSGDMPGGLSDKKRTDLAFAGSDTMSILSPYKYLDEAYHRLLG
jgi:hypothetical protein